MDVDFEVIPAPEDVFAEKIASAGFLEGAIENTGAFGEFPIPPSSASEI